MTTRLEVLRSRGAAAVQREDLEKILKEQSKPSCEAPSVDDISSDVVTTLEGALKDKAEGAMRGILMEIIKEAVREVLAEEV